MAAKEVDPSSKLLFSFLYSNLVLKTPPAFDIPLASYKTGKVKKKKYKNKYMWMLFFFLEFNSIANNFHVELYIIFKIYKFWLEEMESRL